MENMRFKVGDRVRSKSLDWYKENKDEYGTIIFSIESGDYSFTKEDVRFCGRVVTIAYEGEGHYLIAEDDRMYFWIDEMIEGLVEEENKPNFKVGDEVRIKGTDIGGTIESVIRGQLIVNSKGSKIPAWPEDVVLMKSVEEETKPNIIEEAKTYWDSIKDAWICPEGYIFKDENGNIINATKIVLKKKKKEYPKTYEVCLKVLGFNVTHKVKESPIFDYDNDIVALQRLKRCRDAYWKIAGEEMGLGKPWKPDWNDEKQDKYGLYEILKYSFINPLQFVFPTAEMRDTFKENFDSYIEICK